MRVSLKYLFAFSILTFSCFTVGGEEKPMAGFNYSKITTPDKQTVHLLDIDPQQFKIVAVHAKNSALEREPVMSIAKRHKALAAINGGFFRIGEEKDGLPAGILKIQGHWYGIAYRPRAAIGWSNKIPGVYIDRIQTKTSLYLNHHRFPVHLMNQPGVSNKAILYTDAYGKQTNSSPNGFDITIQNNQITHIQASGQTPIPTGGYVYSMTAKQFSENPTLKLLNPAKIDIVVIPQSSKAYQLAWQLVENIIGGSPLLVQNGRVITDYSAERVRPDFIDSRHARTAVGIKKNGHWLLIAVEKSAFTGSPGMTIPELATFMKSVGSEKALNLDGGGSSTFFVKDAVVNHPEGDIDEHYGLSTTRPVSDAILVLPKE